MAYIKDEVKIEEEKHSGSSDSFEFRKRTDGSKEGQSTSNLRSSLLNLAHITEEEHAQVNTQMTSGSFNYEGLDANMQARHENRTLTMLLRTGEKNFEELLNINMEKEME